VLKPCLQWATQHGHAELKRDALWRIYLCHSRLDEPSQAADAALALRADLEQDRAGIADPLKRGGVFSSFKYLFPALCEKLQLAGRPAELLEAIEASKGRGVADILTAKSGRPVADASIYAAVARLPELTRRHQFHYATFNVDDERTYVGFVSKTGEIHAIPPVPLGRAAIRDAALQADPRTAADTARRLAPLVQWIDRLQTEGVIDAADHLCYAPDDDLSNVPFHYLLIDDEPLINRVSLSRIHSAFHLAHVLERDATPPAQYLALVVPTRQNTERDSWTEMARFLREPVTALARLLRGETVEQLDATLEFMRRVDLRRQVLHFSAHGVFPPPESGRAPFAESGVVLSSATGLPDADRIAAGDLVLVLTPSRVLDWKLDLSGSHVSIMTCVSGLSREGLGGDALGLDWAFTQAGAASLVTSHWNVNAKLAASFLSRFYDLWLGKRMPRGRALAHVMRSFREQDDLSAEPHVWAAFSLTGDWR